MIHAQLLLVVFAAASTCGAFVPSRAAAARRRSLAASPNNNPSTSSDDCPSSSGERAAVASPIGICLEARASSGITRSELPRLLGAVASVCREHGVPFDASQIESSEGPSRPGSVPGALGRVLAVRVGGAPPDFDMNESELVAHLEVESSQRIDEVLYGEDGSGRPVLLAFQTDDEDDATLDSAIEKEVIDYGLRDAVDGHDSDQKIMKGELSFVPSIHVEIDGAMVESVDLPGETHFDTSSVLVFDDMVDDSLRQRLLNVVKGNPENHVGADDEWNDVKNGPDPGRWVRGGLVDVVVDENSDDADGGGDGPCWGLTDEAVADICFGHHPAIVEFESMLARLFPDFVVSRLPEAVLGGCVSPLTANAPTYGDAFDYHVDADPLQVPPSPWADVFGRYPNRNLGRPRFVSCLLYLNGEWDAGRWGAPTRFLDPPTLQTYDVLPRPGRFVIMDQDISHTVVAPNAVAGRQPRYSLVWKLVLHPKKWGQDVTEVTCGRRQLWPDPVVIGSANRNIPY